MIIKPEDYVNELVQMSKQLQRAEKEVQDIRQDTRQEMLNQSRVYYKLTTYNDRRNEATIVRLKKEHKKEIEQLKELLEFRRFISKINKR